MRILLVCLFLVLGASRTGFADVTVFENDYDGFLEAVGAVNVIDFDTLPNGEPSMPGVEITDEFNYDAQGVHFSAPIGIPEIGGNQISGFDLGVQAGPLDMTWLIADLVEPGLAVGVTFGGHTTLSIYDLSDQLIAEHEFVGGGGPFFIGFVSDIPIGYATADRNSNVEAIGDFVFAPVPEPGTLALLASGVLLVMRRRPRRAI